MNTATNKPSSPSAVQSSSGASNVAVDQLQRAGQHFVAEPAKDIMAVLKDYVREKPDVAAMWCFGAGLLIGWKLRG